MALPLQSIAALVVLGLAGCRSPTGSGSSSAGPGPVTGLANRDASNNMVTVLDLQTATSHPDGPLPDAPGSFNILVLSGGGAYGAYSAGVLAGWSETGARPDFDVVTGVSSGALVGTLAFLGPSRDPELKWFYTRLSDRDVFVRRPSLSILLSDSAADSRPLERLIDQAVDAKLLRQVATEHRRGRRLYVGTTHLDSRRLVVWDMGAIAARGRPEDLSLFRKVLLASSSLPGLLPPVSIPVEVDGRKYDELHVDGGVTASLFFRPPEVPRERLAALGKRPLDGSNVYVIVAGKLYSDAQPVTPQFLSIVTSSVSALMYAQTRGDLSHLYSIAQATGMNYRQAAIPSDVPVPATSTSFDPTDMRRLFETGRRLARSSNVWRATPPGAKPGEDVPVRTGNRLTHVPLPASRGR